MRKIEYPTDPIKLNAFKNEYISCFGINGSAIERYTKKHKLSKKCKEYKWQTLKMGNADLMTNYGSMSVMDIMLSDYQTLVDVYERYQTCKLSTFEMDTLESIFNYNVYDGNIAQFFISKADQLKIHSCFYCETAYINVYTIMSTKKKYFDVDHVLPKSKCPLVALSLFNFVPSCQVCNSRIKGDALIAKKIVTRRILSPSSSLYDFEGNVSFRLRPLKKGVCNFMANPSLFEVKIKAKKPYDEEVKFFHLEERYEYHKKEALRLKDLKAKYTRRKLSSIASLLRRPVLDVEEDIFNHHFLTRECRCFRKFSLDMLK